MNATLLSLLNLLSDGEFHSGEQLGEVLGISRAAVWKQLAQLRDYGLVLESVRGSGYKLLGPLSFLDAEVIQNTISCEAAKVHVLPTVNSTNQCLLDRFSNGEEMHGEVLFAEHQSDGRGRRGRVWQSPYASNLYFSIAWNFSEGAAVLEGLSLALGVGICRALNDLSVFGVTLKWPNDILFEGKKLAGVLLEMRGDASGELCVVAGIGLNVNMPESQSIDQPWIDLSRIAGTFWDRSLVASTVLKSVLPILDSYSENGFSEYKSEWESLNAYAGQVATVFSGNTSESGICLGVEGNGALILDVGGVEKQFLGGELSLRAC